MEINPIDFQKTISSELKILSKRVRYLIGASNWGEEGRYKEAILKNTIRKFLPSNLNIGTGFVLKEDLLDEENGLSILKSKQIDIIIYDNRYPVLFAEGDFVITTSSSVVGIIEVKTMIKSEDIKEVIDNATFNGRIIGESKYNGIFVFEKGNIYVGQNRINENLEQGLKDSRGIVNHICLGENFFIKYWADPSLSPRFIREPLYRFYEIAGLSSSYFISNLIEMISSVELNDRLWFLYPINNPGGKENNKLYDVKLR